MKIGFVFPGQGSQSVGMMAGFDAHAAIRDTFTEASDVLAEDLWALVTTGPETELNRTVNTQPVMLTAGVAVWRAWQASGGSQPAVLAGHSLGEYTALVAAGALRFADALPLVRFRAQAMQDAVPAGVGAMAAILGLAASTVGETCREAAEQAGAGRIVEPVNFNAPEQTVIAGHKDAVERAIRMAVDKGAKRGVLLPVSAPFHSSLLKPAALRLAERLATVAISSPQLPLLHNVDVAEHRSAESIRTALARQAENPVRWVETIEAFVARGVTHIVECGPGRVLVGLNKRISRELKSLALTDGADIDAARAALTA
jgi:[acyl-carrier-protein] S-malonyltransferase